MLRLNASFSKKIPVQGQDFSSQSYHASIEIEIPDGLTPEQLRDRIHDTFDLVRGSVEAELSGGTAAVPVAMQREEPAPATESAASPRQVAFLTRLAVEHGMDIRALNEMCRREFNAASVEALARFQASRLIDRLNGRGDGRRQNPRRAA